MKKKFTLEIATPCSENFDKMIPNERGSFCNSCMKNVIDLSKKTNSEVAKFIAENKDQSICARLKTTQLAEEFHFNETSKINNLKYAAVAASILLVSNVTAQEKNTTESEIRAPEPVHYTVGKVAYVQNTEEQSIFIKGKLLDAKTNKPFDKKIYQNLAIAINGSKSNIKMSSRTGEFLIPILIAKDSKAFEVTITANDYYLSKTIPFNRSSVKDNVLQQNIIISADELTRIYIAGGLGINYTR
ncbi:hypothetical protein [Flavobacterium tistrianum]|uniref:hypothetical protein n=1 Tax=Flavobacterium tistrianum TaxID=1685414 RepID=UPI000DAE81F1|nr:hypothetical protein [Flavobacterium tistrianum]KAF2342203.1 hypothetical protein DMB71_04705 [Flavobacterium tistrianum]